MRRPLKETLVAVVLSHYSAMKSPPWKEREST
jgi:hypothetical protein